MPKPKLSAKEVLQDLHSGMDDAAMMKKYNLSETGLHQLYDKLVSRGAVKQSELRDRSAGVGKAPPTAIPCPACGKRYAKQLNVCPACGFDRAKETKPQAPAKPKRPKEPPREEAQAEAPSHAYSQRGLDVAGMALTTGKRFVTTGTTRAKRIAEDISQMELVKDLSQMNFVDEIVPIDDSNIIALRRDFIFWFVSLLGVVPLVIATLKTDNAQITSFAVFFAFIWAVIFKRMVMADHASWKFPVASFLFTGTVGMVLLLTLYKVMPSVYMSLADSKNALVSLFGYVFQVGIWEELCKILPVLLYVGWRKLRKKERSPSEILIIGVFSGLAFAAFENVEYAKLSVLRSLELAGKYGADGLAAGVKGAMINVMLRALSLVFCHAVWSGVFAYFIAMASATGRRWGALFVVGLGVSCTLHGAYDWLVGVNLTLAALMAGFSFMLFYAYVSKLKALVPEPR